MIWSKFDQQVHINIYKPISVTQIIYMRFRKIIAKFLVELGASFEGKCVITQTSVAFDKHEIWQFYSLINPNLRNR